MALPIIVVVLVITFPVAAKGVAIISANEGNNRNYAINHIIFNEEGVEFYTTGPWAELVYPQDSFMLMSGNHAGKIDVARLNQQARKLRERHPSVQIYAATSGLDSVRSAVGLNLDLFAGLIMVYEPGFPNSPEFTWDQQRTEEIWREAAGFIRSQGLEAWAKPTGRALEGRDKAGQWDYGALATIMDA
jgi:hypothetical protein